MSSAATASRARTTTTATTIHMVVSDTMFPPVPARGCASKEWDVPMTAPATPPARSRTRSAAAPQDLQLGLAEVDDRPGPVEQGDAHRRDGDARSSTCRPPASGSSRRRGSRASRPGSGIACGSPSAVIEPTVVPRTLLVTLLPFRVTLALATTPWIDELATARGSARPPRTSRSPTPCAWSGRSLEVLAPLTTAWSPRFSSARLFVRTFPSVPWQGIGRRGFGPLVRSSSSAWTRVALEFPRNSALLTPPPILAEVWATRAVVLLGMTSIFRVVA